MKKLNIGSGVCRLKGFINVDRAQFIDDKGKGYTDVICDIERERLPFEDNSIDEISCDQVLEHIGHSTDNPDKQNALIFVMNEMWRVLTPTGILWGSCPHEGGQNALADPTHQRLITKRTFDYFIGRNRQHEERASRPRNTDYGIKPWYMVKFSPKITFKLRPRKTSKYDSTMEQL